MNKNRKMIFNDHAMTVFSDFNTDAEGLKNLMVDLSLGREIYSEGKLIPKAEAEDKCRKMNMAFFGLEPGYSKRDFKRAVEEHGRYWFQIIEEVVDVYTAWGIRESELFNQVVNLKNRALGDDNLFWIDAPDIILSVAKVGTSHHDYILQRLNEGQSFTVPVARYGAAIGYDLNKYMAGQEDVSKLIANIGKAIILKQQTEIATLVKSAATKLPVTNGFVKSGPMSAASVSSFDEMLAAVSMANDGADLTIFGTRLGLQKMSGLMDVNWISTEAKSDVYNAGVMGTYKGSTLVEIPNRFMDKTLSMNNTLYDDTKLYVFANGVDNTLIDAYTYGETEINEITEKGEEHGRIDDLGKYEVQQSWGFALRVRRQFGQWTITS